MNKREALKQLQAAFHAVEQAWDDTLEDGYPFHGSFDDLVFEVGAWVEQHTQPITLERIRSFLNADDKVEYDGVVRPFTTVQLRNADQTFFTVDVYRDGTYEVLTHTFHMDLSSHERIVHGRFLALVNGLGLTHRGR